MADNEKEENKVYFCGRLATYRYINTDEVIEKALECFDEIKANHGS
jgi:UDP-galactopyranose mutase